MTVTSVEPSVAGLGGLPLIFEAKLRTPRLASYLRRDRLYRRLDADKSPLVVIHADAGYGKTTLVASFLQEHGRQSVWYHVGSTDKVPGTFVAHVSHALAGTSPDWVGEGREGPASAKDPEFGGAFLAGLFNQLDSPIDLVLEDYHRSEIDSEIHRVVLAMVEHLSAGKRVYILSRVRPHLPISRLTMSGKVQVLSKGDLAFTPEETAALFASDYGRVLADEELAIVMARLEGWPAGLRLAQEALKSTKVEQRERFWSFFAESPTLFDYLAEEVLVALPPAMLTFLYKTSIFAVLQPELIEEYLPGCGALVQLQRLAKENLFTTALSGIGTSYRYHSLFRQFLRRQLLEVVGQEGVRLLHEKAADLYARREEIGYAIAHSLVAGNYQRVTRLFSGLVRHQQSSILIDLMEGWLERVFPDMEGDCGAAGPRVLPLSAYEAVLPDLMRIAEAPMDAVDRIAQAHAQQRLGTYLLSSGRLDQCLNWLRQSRDTFRAAGRSISAAHSSTMLVFAYIYQGMIEMADAALIEALALAGSEGSFAVMNALLAKSDLALARGHFREAEDAARASLKVTVPSLVGSSLSLGCLSLALVYQGRMQEALDAANEALTQAHMGAFSLETGIAQVRLAVVLRAIGRLEDAAAAANRAIEFTKKSGHWLARAMLARAEIAAAASEPAAERLWDETRAFWQDHGYRMHAGYDGLIAPALLGRQAKPQLAAVTSGEAAAACTSASTRSLSNGFSLIARSADTSLIIQTFGALRLRVDGRDSTPSCWSRSSARRLFCYLLVNRHRIVPRDELLEAFWPEDDPDHSINRLWVAVHVLRRELAPLSRVVDRHGQGYRLYLPQDAQLDVDRYISLTANVPRAEPAALQTAVSLYQGDFLAEFPYEDFIQPERTRLRELHLGVIMRLAESAEEQKDGLRALEWYRKAHQLDPLMGRPVQRLMELLADAGEVAAALEVYNRHDEAMKRALDLDPSLELQSLYRRVVAKSRLHLLRRDGAG